MSVFRKHDTCDDGGGCFSLALGMLLVVVCGVVAAILGLAG